MEEAWSHQMLFTPAVERRVFITTIALSGTFLFFFCFLQIHHEIDETRYKKTNTLCKTAFRLRRRPLFVLLRSSTRSTSTCAVKAFQWREFPTERWPNSCSGRSKRRFSFTVWGVFKSQSCLDGHRSGAQHKLEVNIKHVSIITRHHRGNGVRSAKICWDLEIWRTQLRLWSDENLPFRRKGCLRSKRQKWQKIYLSQGNVSSSANLIRTLLRSFVDVILNNKLIKTSRNFFLFLEV